MRGTSPSGHVRGLDVRCFSACEAGGRPAWPRGAGGGRGCGPDRLCEWGQQIPEHPPPGRPPVGSGVDSPGAWDLYPAGRPLQLGTRPPSPRPQQQEAPAPDGAPLRRPPFPTRRRRFRLGEERAAPQPRELWPAVRGAGAPPSAEPGPLPSKTASGGGIPAQRACPGSHWMGPSLLQQERTPATRGQRRGPCQAPRAWATSSGEQPLGPPKAKIRGPQDQAILRGGAHGRCCWPPPQPSSARPAGAAGLPLPGLSRSLPPPSEDRPGLGLMAAPQQRGGAAGSSARHGGGTRCHSGQKALLGHPRWAPVSPSGRGPDTNLGGCGGVTGPGVPAPGGRPAAAGTLRSVRSVLGARPSLALGHLRATLRLPPLQHSGPGSCHPDRCHPRLRQESVSRAGWGGREPGRRATGVTQ